MTAVLDGILDPNLYANSSIKIAHLLKQPTKNEESIPQIVIRLRDENSLGGGLFYRLALRSYGILNGFASYSQCRREKPAILGQALGQSAIINLADDVFSKSTSPEQLHQLAFLNKNKWLNKISQCKPDIVLCSGTFNVVTNILQQNENATCSCTGMCWFKFSELDCIFCDVPHPSVRYPLAMVHTYIMEGVRDIWKQRASLGLQSPSF
jgi:hypothetical protein